MNLQALTDRMTHLLQGQQVEWVRQDDPLHITIKFVEGPQIQIGVVGEYEGSPELDCSITACVDASEAWIARAEDLDAPGPVKR
jgi:hypothetical protein